MAKLTFLDWLINRRHCQQQWQAVSLIVREKINTALVDMPAVEEITKLLQGTCKLITSSPYKTESEYSQVLTLNLVQKGNIWI